jgi:hypothetical protein
LENVIHVAKVTFLLFVDDVAINISFLRNYMAVGCAVLLIEVVLAA